jgi:hypothetical protein
MKKFIKKTAMFLATITLLSTAATTPAFAAGCGAGDGSSFLKLIPTWHQYLEKDANCEIADFQFPGDIWKVAIAVVDILLRFAGIIAFGFIIKAGFTYTLSRGNPQEAAKARQSIIDAAIGIAITSIATLLVAFLGRALTKS